MEVVGIPEIPHEGISVAEVARLREFDFEQPECSRSPKTSEIRLLHTTVRIVANSATSVGNFYRDTTELMDARGCISFCPRSSILSAVSVV